MTQQLQTKPAGDFRNPDIFRRTLLTFSGSFAILVLNNTETNETTVNMARKDLTSCFEREIASGIIVEDGKIPPFRTLAERYECSPATIKRLVDHFELKGMLRTIRGSGTFITGADIRPQRPRRQQIGAIVLDDQFQRELDRLKEEYLDLGWFFTVYNASADHQSPEREKNFLKLAREQDFEAVILEATPIEPVNTELFQQLRHEGVKVVHLSPYRADMRAESSFMPDFYSAGQLGIVRAALKNYRNVLLYSGDVQAPFLDLSWRGAAMMADQLGVDLLPPVPGESPEAAVGRAREAGSTVIFCVHTGFGEEILERSGGVCPGRLGIVSLGATSADKPLRHSYFDYPYAELMAEVMEYATDRSRNPFEAVQRIFVPKFIDNNSL